MSVITSIDPAFFAGLDAPTSFFILRHGETTANAEGRIQGRSEYYLNDNGRAQAHTLAAYLKDKRISRLFHSPLARAAETAAIVAACPGMPEAEAEASLVELDTGSFTALTWKEIAERFPAEFAAFSSQSWEGVPDAERAEALYQRAISAWLRLKAAALESGGNIAAISHGGTIQWLVRVTFGCRGWMPLLTTGNCGVFELYVGPAGPGKPAYLQWRELNLIPQDDVPGIAPVF